MRKRKVTVHEIRPCSDEYGVVQVETSGGVSHLHRREPCEQCPWRMDVAVGEFPAQAFRESAHTAYDGAMETFGCHMSGSKRPQTCAGFLLRHGENNNGVRLAAVVRRFDPSEVTDGGKPIYPSYREMAVANGVSEDDPVLAGVRAEGDEWDHVGRRWSSPDGKRCK